jgi:hypothetical protein
MHQHYSYVHGPSKAWVYNSLIWRSRECGKNIRVIATMLILTSDCKFNAVCNNGVFLITVTFLVKESTAIKKKRT